MGGKGRKSSEPPKPGEDKPKKPPRTPVEKEADYEDGDIATPKRDRSDPDNEPL